MGNKGRSVLILFAVGSLLCALLALVYFIGIIFEFEYPYIFTLSRVKGANTLNGEPAIAVIASSLGVADKDVDLHTCSYCVGVFNPASDAVHVQISAPEGSEFYHFAYDERQNQLVPASQSTLEFFGRMTTPGTEYDATGSVFGKDKLILPRSWFVSGQRLVK